MYELIYLKKFDKQLNKLSINEKLRILKTLERCRIRPYSHVKKLVASPYFRLRVGDFRIILNIKNEKLIILVLELGQRRNIYDKK